MSAGGRGITDNTEKKRGDSRFGLAVGIALGLLATAAVAFLVAGRGPGRGEDGFSVSGGRPPSANYQVEATPGGLSAGAASFRAVPAVARAGGRVELHWDVPGAEAVKITGIEGTFGERGRHILASLGERVLAATGTEGHASDPDVHAFTIRARMADGGERILTAGVKVTR